MMDRREFLETIAAVEEESVGSVVGEEEVEPAVVVGVICTRPHGAVGAFVGRSPAPLNAQVRRYVGRQRRDRSETFIPLATYPPSLANLRIVGTGALGSSSK